ncbi:cytochrome c family protein [Burkholderia thailandensis MSMB121]|uniref:c-type cytochrome n=1 Tax=Burkholderia humptydooensis TaxID=430531 RepID=UPI000327FA47|nr:cytochrome c family protein [Burkholderia thailandensis MSMB121]
MRRDEDLPERVLPEHVGESKPPLSDHARSQGGLRRTAGAAASVTAHPPAVPALVPLFALTLALSAVVTARADGSPTDDPGEAIYRNGVLSSGAPLQALREGGLRMEGSAVACVNCHRRSGLGAKSGFTSIPPIAGTYLFNPSTLSGERPGMPYVESMRSDRAAYTDVMLARAIRSGIDAQGQRLGYLMPRYALNDDDMAALLRYLKRLDPRPAPGVTDNALHFATITTPDADPVKRHAMLDVLRHYFADKDAFPTGAAPPHPSSDAPASVPRRWQLHVWELSGAASTWEAQLARHLAAEPVFAVISGMGGRTWAPVRAFCERARIPCLFPNVEVPAVRNDDFYSIYFSNGVLLEAGLIASEISRGKHDVAPQTVHEVYRVGDSGEAGAQALATALRARGFDVSLHALMPADRVARVLNGISKNDALVLWLRPADIATLGDAAPTRMVYMSGMVGGLDHAPLPGGWRAVTHIAYPFDMPDRVRRRVDYMLDWAATRHIPIVDQQIQADTFLACVLLEEALGHVTGTYVRDYLVERIEDTLEQRVITGYYPRLTLAPGQRLASKGGYMVRFADSSGTRIVADGAWTVP